MSIVEGLLSSGPPTAETDDGDLGYLGMPKNYVATGTVRTAVDPEFRRPGQPRYETATQIRPPLYPAGAEMEPRSYSPEQVARLQHQMAMAGLIGPETKYRLGVWDPVSASAYKSLLGYANQGGIDRMTALQELAAQPLASQRDLNAPDPLEELREKRRQMELSFDTRLNTYDRSDPASLRQTAEAAFQQALGRKPKQGEMDAFVNAFLERERSSQETVFQAQDALEYGARGRARASLDPAAGPEGIDAFMNAMSAQESGGNYNAKNGRTGASGRFQIMPSNWGPWSKEAGLGANAKRTPENQDKVARFKMEQYYEQFGSWDAVAVAWYAGPGAVKGYQSNPQASRYTRKQGKGNEPSINEYVSSVMGKFGVVNATSPGGPPMYGPMIDGRDGSVPTSEAGMLWQRLQQLIADAPGRVTPGPRSRDYATQVKLWERYKAGKGPLAAEPGTSKHTDGRANDLKYENQATKRWVLQNAHRYGLAFPLLNHGEDWHIELAAGHSIDDGHNHGGGAAPISRDVVSQRQDVGAQALEYARNSNPTEARAFDIGGQFETMMALLQRGVGV